MIIASDFHLRKSS